MRDRVPPPRKRNRPGCAGSSAASCVVLVLVVGGPFVYIHFIEGPAPREALALHGDHAPDRDLDAAPAAPLAGTWKIGTGIDRGLPREGDPVRPVEHRGRPHEQRHRIDDDRGHDGDEGVVHAST